MSQEVSIKVIIDGINNAQSALNDTVNGIRGAEDQAKKTEASFQSLASSLQQIGVIAAGVGAVLEGAFALAVNAAGQFEQGLGRVKAVVQSDIGDANELKTAMTAVADEAKRLGLETAYTSTQATGAMKELAQAGYNTSQIIASTGTVMKMAAAAEITMADSAGILVNIMSPFGLAADKAGQTANTLTVAANATTSSIAELGHAMAYAAPAAAAIGMTVEQTAAALGVLHDAGIKGSMAGTTLRGMLVSLSNPTEKAREALANLGVEIQKDEKGNVKFSETMQLLKNANMGLSESVAIFNRHVAAGALAIANTTGKMDEITAKSRTSKDALDQFQKTIETNLITSLTKLGASIQQLAIDMAGPLLKPLAFLVDSFTTFVNWIDRIATQVPILSGVFMALVGILGAILVPLGLLIAAFGTFVMLLESAMRASGVLTGVKEMLAVAIGKVTTSAAGATAAIGAMTRATVVASEATGVLTRAKTALSGAMGGTIGIAGQVGIAFSGMGLAASSSILGIPDDLQGINNGMGQLIAMAPLLGGVFGPIAAAIAGAGAAVWQIATNWRELLGLPEKTAKETDGVVKATDHVLTGSERAAAAQKSANETAKEAAISAAKMGQTWAEFSAKQKEKPSDEVVHVFLQARLAVKGLAESYAEVNHVQKDFARDAATSGTTLIEFEKSFKAAFNKDVPEDVGKIYGQMFKDVHGGIGGMLTDLDKASEITKDMARASGVSKEELTKWVSEAKKFAEEIKTGFKALDQDLDARFKNMNESVKGSMDTWKDSKKNIEQGVEGSASAFGSFSDSVRNGIDGAVSFTTDRMTALQAALNQAVSSKQPKVEIDAIKEAIGEFGKSADKGLRDLGNSLTSAFKDARTEYDKILKDMDKLAKDMEKKREKYATEAEEAIHNIRIRNMSAWEQFQERGNQIAARRAQADELMALGGKENIEKAIELRTKNIQEEQKLGQVQMTRYDMLSKAEKTQVDQEMRDLNDLAQLQKISGKGVEVLDTEQKYRLDELKKLKSEKIELVDKEKAAELAVQLVTADEEERQKAVIALEALQVAEGEKKKKQVAAEMADLQTKLDKVKEIQSTLASQVSVTLNLDGAAKQLEDLFKSRNINVSLQTRGGSGGSEPGFAAGGGLPGFGGGDTVPAWLEPGEWIINKWAVRAATSLFGPNFFGALNALGGAASSFGSGVGSYARSASAGISNAMQAAFDFAPRFAEGGLVGTPSGVAVIVDFSQLGDRFQKLEDSIAKMGGQLATAIGNQKVKMDVKVKDERSTTESSADRI